VLVNLGAVVALHQFVDCDLDTCQIVHFKASRLVGLCWVKPLLSLYVCVKSLLLNKVALK
jgi:hypothetical protein